MMEKLLWGPNPAMCMFLKNELDGGRMFVPDGLKIGDKVRLLFDVYDSHGTFKAGSVLSVVGYGSMGYNFQDVDSGKQLLEFSSCNSCLLAKMEPS